MPGWVVLLLVVSTVGVLWFFSTRSVRARRSGISVAPLTMFGGSFLSGRRSRAVGWTWGPWEPSEESRRVGGTEVPVPVRVASGHGLLAVWESAIAVHWACLGCRNAGGDVGDRFGAFGFTYWESVGAELVPCFGPVEALEDLDVRGGC